MSKDKKAVWGWAMYDWANSAFATTVMAGFFPIFFKKYWSYGADVNTKGPFSFTALHLALLDNDYRNIATWLISQGADVNAKTKRRLGDDKKIKPDILHVTPLHMAVASGDKDMVELLISKGAKVNARDTSGNTPLDYATKYGYTEVAELLRRHGAR